jgi:glycosyltransferase involved in cell wall biosynthesis
MTRIAVLLPCYNPPITELKVTLESLRKQTLPFRLFIVDDGSKTRIDYESHLAGLDAQVLRLPKNLGITGAMNAGVAEILKGPFEYIARIDAGDISAPERFALQMPYMDSHPKVGILGSAVDFRLFDAAGELVGTSSLVFPETHEGCRKFLFIRSAMIHPAMMIRRAVFEKLKGYSEEYPAAEDYEIQWRAVANGFELANLPQTLLIKEETPGSISQLRRRRQMFNRMRIQWDNLSPLEWRSWAGIAKSLFTWAAPARLINLLKLVRGGKR